MSLTEIIQLCANLGVAVVAAAALIYVHVRQIPAIISALKSEGAENRTAMRDECEQHRTALKEITDTNRTVLGELAETFERTLSSDRSRCDAREELSRQARHHLAERIRHTEQDRAVIAVAVARLEQVAEKIKITT